MIAEALRAVILADAEISGALASYNFGAGPEPAVFTIDPIPRDSALPAVIIREVSGVPFETRAQEGAEQDVDVMLWGNKQRSVIALKLLAWDLYYLIHRCNPAITGHREIGVYASPPQGVTDDEGFPGFRVPVMVRVLRN